jgi:hypothetical protein
MLYQRVKNGWWWWCRTEDTGYSLAQAIYYTWGHRDNNTNYGLYPYPNEGAD